MGSPSKGPGAATPGPYAGIRTATVRAVAHLASPPVDAAGG
jgi:hypothetical protein